MAQTSKEFVHLVSEPIQAQYHRPQLGGHYSARFVDVSTVGHTSFLTWQGYDPATTDDHIYVQRVKKGFDEQPVCLSEQAGAYEWPRVCARNADEADILWISQGRHVMITSLANARWSKQEYLFSSQDWLRDLALARDPTDTLWCAYVQSYRQNDQLVICHRQANQWIEINRLRLEGFVSRPSLAAGPSDELHLAFDRYVSGRYVVELRTLKDKHWARSHIIADCRRNNFLARLTVDHTGKTWVSYLSEQIVEREGVIGRAATIRVSGLGVEGWSNTRRGNDADIAHLYLGLLPKRTYFGYNGLRRNPLLVATEDGLVHLVWEAQRAEDEKWDNLNNGRLLAASYDGRRWGPVKLWHDGGCCFAGDHRTVHPSQAVSWFLRTEHRENSADWKSLTIDPHKARRIAATDLAPWQGWKPYAPRSKPRRHTVELDGRELTLFFGDLHSHSILSNDAEGYPDELYHFARDVASVDFTAITDNDFYPSKPFFAGELDRLWHLGQRLEQPSKFIPFCGYEWTFHRDDTTHSYNHRSIVFLSRECKIIRRIEPAGSSEEAFRRELLKMDALAHPHHAQFTHLQTPQEANVEITSGWAVNIDFSETIHRELNTGKKFGFAGSSDSHRILPGLGGALTAVWAADLTRDAIVEALRARRCYATTGNRIRIDFRLNGAMMGSTVQTGQERRFSLHVAAQTPLRSVKIIRGGETACEFEPGAEEFRAEWCDSGARREPCWYYLRVEDETPYKEYPHNICQATGPWAWSSPIWVMAE